MKGIAFTLDSVLALLIMVTIISLLLFFRTETSSPFFQSQQLHSLSEDALTILSESTLGEVTNQTLLDYYKQKGILNESDFDKKAIDIIGALWASNNTTANEAAANISKNILGDIMPDNVGYQVLINGFNVYNSSDTSRPPYGDEITAEISSSRIASGYEKFKPVSGYVARAWASKITRNMTKIIPINLAWGEFNRDDSAYWGNGYAPAGERDGTAILIKNFTIPSDSTIFSQFLQFAPDTQNAQIMINGNKILSFASAGSNNNIFEVDLKNNITSGSNQLKIIFNNSNYKDLSHFHPGTYIKIKYNTSSVDSGSTNTTFYSDWIQGSPAAAEIIPFFVNAHITNVTSYVDVQNINAFLLLTLNYKYNASNPMQNVILYRNYTPTIDCGQFNQIDCPSHVECYWDPNAPLENITIFNDGFEIDITTNWTVSSNWTRANDQRHTGSYSAKKSASIGSGNLTSKSANASDTTEIYVDFWYRDDDTDVNEITLEYNDSSGHWNSIADLSSSTEDYWNNYKSKVTDTQYLHKGFAVRFRGSRLGRGENFWIDDVKILKTINGKCVNIESNDAKNRTYEIKLNETGTLINEYNSAGSLLNNWFNTNITINNIHENMTNSFGIYADIRAPKNLTADASNGDVDWQRLGMYANDNTAGHGSDHLCFITDKTNVTVYHDLEQYGLEYGKVDINAIENFTDPYFICETKPFTNSCKNAIINLSFPFSTRIIKSRVIGTQKLGGNDNGYNFVWIWYQGQTNESNLVLDTDTPPGTITYLPTKFFGLNKINTVRAADKDNGRWLETDLTTYMGSRRSIVEYTFLIPSQVGYGSIFENQSAASTDAINRLNDILGKYSTSADIYTENYTVSNVPHIWGPADIKVRIWI